MALARLQERVPSATVIGTYMLGSHQLRFHKYGMDGSAKCDAYFTGRASDHLYGVVFDIQEAEKYRLDLAEGLGRGYDEKEVVVVDNYGNVQKPFLYYATDVDDSLLPFSWYKEHVLTGARAAMLPACYIELIVKITVSKDSNIKREQRELSIYS